MISLKFKTILSGVVLLKFFRFQEAPKNNLPVVSPCGLNNDLASLLCNRPCGSNDDHTSLLC